LTIKCENLMYLKLLVELLDLLLGESCKLTFRFAFREVAQVIILGRKVKQPFAINGSACAHVVLGRQHVFII
jgi:hypothetical protein